MRTLFRAPRMESSRVLDAAAGLGILALLRLMHPERDIVLCGGRTSTLGEWDRLGLTSNANGMMVGDYLTKKGGPFERDQALARDLTDLARDLGVCVHVPG